MNQESIDVVAGIIQNEREVLVAKRPHDTHLSGFWEFPGGKPEPGESDSETLQRELQEELGIHVSTGSLFHSVTHEYEQRTVHLRFYTCKIEKDSPPPEPIECEEVRWVHKRNLPSLSFPPADRELLNILQNETLEQS